MSGNLSVILFLLVRRQCLKIDDTDSVLRPYYRRFGLSLSWDSIKTILSVTQLFIFLVTVSAVPVSVHLRPSVSVRCVFGTAPK